MCPWTSRSYTGARRSVLVDTLRSHCHCPARVCVTVGFAHTACSHPLGHGSRSTLQHINESGSLDEFDGYVGKKAYLEMDAVYVRGDGCLAAMHVSSVMVNGKVLCLRKVPMSPRAQLEIQPLRTTASSQSAHPTSAHRPNRCRLPTCASCPSCAQNFPHVTLWHSPNVRPSESNALTRDCARVYPLRKRLKLCGLIRKAA